MRNKEDFLKHVISILQSSTLVTRCMCVLSVLLYLIGLIPGTYSQLVMTPGFLIPPQVKIWTLITAPFFETSVVVLLADLAVLTAVGYVLEPLWNLRSYLIFIGIVNGAGLSVAALICFVLYIIVRIESLLFLSFHGLYGFVCACSVAIKQAHPDRPLAPVLSFLRYKDLPILLLFLSSALTLLGVLSLSYSVMSLTYIMVSWVYLRFYQIRADGSRGDMSENFSFASFFPEPIQLMIMSRKTKKKQQQYTMSEPVVAMASGSVFQVLVIASICPEAVRTYDVGASSSNITITLPGTLPADAQRRKQRAIKALSERLTKLEQPPSSQWPSMEDEESTPSQPLPEGSPETVELESVTVETKPTEESNDDEPTLTTTDQTS